MKKSYLILGASSDLGCALIKEIIKVEQEEFSIIAHYNSTNENIRQIMEENPECNIKIIQADLSDLSQTEQMISIINNMGEKPTHIVSFAASYYKFNRLSEFDCERLNDDMTIQVYSFAEICKAFIPNMQKEKYGRIVTMLSAATKGIPPKNTTEYTTVKYALWGLIKSLAADYGEYGICINAISPGMIETKFIKNIGRKIKEFTAERNPQHRNLNINDVLPTISLLLSDGCQFMNGTNVNLGGNPD